jgi:hypothetical protein
MWLPLLDRSPQVVLFTIKSYGSNVLFSVCVHIQVYITLQQCIVMDASRHMQQSDVCKAQQPLQRRLHLIREHIAPGLRCARKASAGSSVDHSKATQLHRGSGWQRSVGV